MFIFLFFYDLLFNRPQRLKIFFIYRDLNLFIQQQSNRRVLAI